MSGTFDTAASSAPSLSTSSTAPAGDEDGNSNILLTSTNASSRALSDLHKGAWVALLAANITARTLLFHPLQLALARKRVTREEKPPSTLQLLRASWRGGEMKVRAGTTAAAAATAGNSSNSTSYNSYQLGKGGICGMYRGVGAALLCNLAGEICYLMTLESCKEFLVTEQKVLAGGGDASSKAAVHLDEIIGQQHTEHVRVSADHSSGSGSSSVSELDFNSNALSSAAAAMAGDAASLALVTPFVIAANKQFTAGYGLNKDNVYRSMPATLSELWGQFRDPAAVKTSLFSREGLRARRLSLQDGLRSLYQGTSSGILRIPSSGCWWWLYSKSKEVLYTWASPALIRWQLQEAERERERQGHGHGQGQGEGGWTRFWKKNLLLSPTDNVFLNATAGIVASTLTTILFNPLAVLQTRQQTLSPESLREMRAHYYTQGHTHPTAAVLQHLQRYPRVNRVSRMILRPFSSAVLVAQDLHRREGKRGFFKGVTTNIYVAVFDGVVFALLFELTKWGSDREVLASFNLA